MNQRVRLALIGCGAVAKILHLPAMARVNEVELAALVDPSVERASRLAGEYGVRRVVRDFHEVIDEIDAAVVAAPNYLHAPIAIDLLRSGIDVLVEKPMALNSQDAGEMIAAARECRGVLAVGMEMRFFHPSRFVKQILAKNLLGEVHSFDLRIGVESKWPATTDYFLHRDLSGGGVLIIHGVHVLDLLLWWLGDYQEVAFFDDALGGVESNCEMELRLRGGARGHVEISRLRTLRNTCLIQGSRASLEIELWNPDGQVYFALDDDLVLHGAVASGNQSEQTSPQEIFQRQLVDFVQAIRERRLPFVSGQEAIRAVRLIEACYRFAQPLDWPWMRPSREEHEYRRVV